MRVRDNAHELQLTLRLVTLTKRRVLLIVNNWGFIKKLFMLNFVADKGGTCIRVYLRTCSNWKQVSRVLGKVLKSVGHHCTDARNFRSISFFKIKGSKVVKSLFDELAFGVGMWYIRHTWLAYMTYMSWTKVESHSSSWKLIQ